MKEKLIQNKLTIKSLKDELEEMDIRVKEIILQKHSEIQDQLHSSSKQLNQSELEEFTNVTNTIL